MKGYVYRILFVCAITYTFMYTFNLYAPTYRVRETTNGSGNAVYEVTEHKSFWEILGENMSKSSHRDRD